MGINKTYWEQAKIVGVTIGWSPLLIYSQWQLETGNFTSNNLVKNNNIAGQTWNSKLNPVSMKGTARPKAEGGFYIKYENAMQGYIDFVTRNKRYAGVKNGKTAEEQAELLASCGWAVDPQYASKLKSLIATNRGLLGEGASKVSESVSKPVQAKYSSLVDYLKDHGYKSDFVSRRKLAEKYGIKHYTGTAGENSQLLEYLQK